MHCCCCSLSRLSVLQLQFPTVFCEEAALQLREEFAIARAQWKPLTFYQKFEQVIVLILTGLMAAVILLAVWTLTLKIVASLLLSGTLDLTDYAVFQTIFGMMLTVIIALEFKRSLLVVAERRESIVQVRTVILLAFSRSFAS